MENFCLRHYGACHWLLVLARSLVILSQMSSDIILDVSFEDVYIYIYIYFDMRLTFQAVDPSVKWIAVHKTGGPCLIS